jgi:hypothetical protein
MMQGEKLKQLMTSAVSFLIVGAIFAGIASYFFVAATSYPRSTGYLDARCSSSGHGFPKTYHYRTKKNQRDEVCCEAAIYVSLLGNASKGFAGELKRRNCKKVQSIDLFGEERSRLGQAACPEYYSQIMRSATAADSNGTVFFACKYNPEKRSSPFEVCISDSFSCDIVTITEYDELQNYDRRQTQFVPLFLFFIFLGVALILFGCASYLRQSLALAATPHRQEFSKFDDDNHAKSGSSAPV